MGGDGWLTDWEDEKEGSDRLFGCRDRVDRGGCGWDGDDAGENDGVRLRDCRDCVDDGDEC